MLYFNSIYIDVVTTVGQVFFSVLAGFAYARMRFKGRNLLFICYIGTMMVPSMVTLIPRYVIMSKLGWVDTHFSVIAPVLLGTPFAVFLMRQFFMTLPQQLMDAAVIDGASYPRVFFQIYLPLTRPILSTLGIFCFMGSWNDFLWPVITLQSHNLKPPYRSCCVPGAVRRTVQSAHGRRGAVGHTGSHCIYLRAEAVH